MTSYFNHLLLFNFYILANLSVRGRKRLRANLLYFPFGETGQDEFWPRPLRRKQPSENCVRAHGSLTSIEGSLWLDRSADHTSLVVMDRGSIMSMLLHADSAVAWSVKWTRACWICVSKRLIVVRKNTERSSAALRAVIPPQQIYIYMYDINTTSILRSCN